MAISRWMGATLIVLATAAAAWTGARFEPGSWYQSLQKPFYTPPDFVFPLVWSLLYALMAVAAILIWLAPAGSQRRWALTLYGGQLIANAAWSWLFFGLHQIGWALLDLIVLLALVSGCLVTFRQIKPLAATLLAPYLIWAGFAGVLNFHIWLING